MDFQHFNCRLLSCYSQISQENKSSAGGCTEMSSTGSCDAVIENQEQVSQFAFLLLNAIFHHIYSKGTRCCEVGVTLGLQRSEFRGWAYRNWVM